MRGLARKIETKEKIQRKTDGPRTASNRQLSRETRHARTVWPGCREREGKIEGVGGKGIAGWAEGGLNRKANRGCGGGSPAPIEDSVKRLMPGKL